MVALSRGCVVEDYQSGQILNRTLHSGLGDHPDSTTHHQHFLWCSQPSYRHRVCHLELGKMSFSLVPWELMSGEVLALCKLSAVALC